MIIDFTVAEYFEQLQLMEEQYGQEEDLYPWIYVRTGKKQMRLGCESDPRNKALMKMFNLINIGERAGSGVPNIFNVWADEGWEDPLIEERFDPDRTVLSLSFKKKVAKKTLQNYETILEFMQSNVWYKATELLAVVSVKESRLKVLLSELAEQGTIEIKGSTKGKVYRKQEIHKTKTK